MRSVIYSVSYVINVHCLSTLLNLSHALEQSRQLAYCLKYEKNASGFKNWKYLYFQKCKYCFVAVKLQSSGMRTRKYILINFSLKLTCHLYKVFWNLENVKRESCLLYELSLFSSPKMFRVVSSGRQRSVELGE